MWRSNNFMSYTPDLTGRDKSRPFRHGRGKVKQMMILTYSFHVQLESISASIQKLCSITVLHFGH